MSFLACDMAKTCVRVVNLAFALRTPRKGCTLLHGAEAAQEAARELLALAHAPTAFVSGQNLLTVGARRALQELGLQRRVALIGFDDLPLADLLEPGLSVIAQDHDVIGREAAGLLFERLGGEVGPARHRVLPTRYLARGSGELSAPEG